MIVNFHFRNGPITQLASYNSTDLCSSLVTNKKKTFRIAILRNTPKFLNILEHAGNFNKNNVTLSYQIEVHQARVPALKPIQRLNILVAFSTSRQIHR